MAAKNKTLTAVSGNFLDSYTSQAVKSPAASGVPKVFAKGMKREAGA